jgi:hypothetical protein
MALFSMLKVPLTVGTMISVQSIVLVKPLWTLAMKHTIGVLRVEMNWRSHVLYRVHSFDHFIECALLQARGLSHGKGLKPKALRTWVMSGTTTNSSFSP